MEQHVKVIGILDIIFGAICAAGGLLFMIAFMFFTPTIIADYIDDPAIATAIMFFGIIGGALFLCFGSFQLIVGLKLRQHKPWARIAQIVLSILYLPNFPLGTSFGVYYLWAMFNEDTIELFE
jgi:hypothetical protein